MNVEAQKFYGDSYAKVKDSAKLDLAYDRLVKACAAGVPSLADKMLALAAKSEAGTFAEPA